MWSTRRVLRSPLWPKTQDFRKYQSFKLFPKSLRWILNMESTQATDWQWNHISTMSFHLTSDGDYSSDMIIMKRLSFLSVNCKPTRDLWYLFYFQFYHNFILDFERIFCCVYLSICMFSFENYNRKNISSNVNVNETVNQTLPALLICKMCTQKLYLK